MISPAADDWGQALASFSEDESVPGDEPAADEEPVDAAAGGWPALIGDAWWSPGGDRLLVATHGEWDAVYGVVDLETGAYRRLEADIGGHFLTSTAGWLDDSRIAFTERAIRGSDGREDLVAFEDPVASGTVWQIWSDEGILVEELPLPVGARVLDIAADGSALVWIGGWSEQGFATVDVGSYDLRSGEALVGWVGYGTGTACMRRCRPTEAPWR